MQITQINKTCDINYYIVQNVFPYSQTTATYNFHMPMHVRIGMSIFVVFQKNGAICSKILTLPPNLIV